MVNSGNNNETHSNNIITVFFMQNIFAIQHVLQWLWKLHNSSSLDPLFSPPAFWGWHCEHRNFQGLDLCILVIKQKLFDRGFHLTPETKHMSYKQF